MKNLDPRRARWIRTRMGILCGVMGLALGGIVSSAWRVQVEDGPEWRDMAEKQRQRRLHIEPKRGTIYDRNGASLAVSIEVPSVSADVVEMLRNVDGRRGAGGDAPRRRSAASARRSRSTRPTSTTSSRSRHRFVWIKRRVSSDEAEAIRDLGDPKRQPHPIHGLTIEGEGHRYYPGRELAGPLLGFVAPDGHGQGRPGARARRGPARQGRGGAWPARSERPSDLRGRRARARPCRATTSCSLSTRASSTSPSASSTRRCTPTRPRAASLVVVDPFYRGDPRARERPWLQPQRLHRQRRRRAARSRGHRSLRARLGHEAVPDGGGPRGGDAQAHRLDQLRARRLPDRRHHDPRHPPERHADADADPGEELEHRRAQDRPAAGRAGALRDLPALRVRRAHRHPAAGRGVGRAPPQGARLVRRRDGERELRPGHQRDDAPARDGDERHRQRGPPARADPRQEGHRRPRRHRARIERPRAARGRAAGGRADRGRDADGRDRGRGNGRRGGDPGLPRRRQDVDRAEGRPRDGQVLDREVHGGRSSASFRSITRGSSWPSCSTSR